MKHILAAAAMSAMMVACTSPASLETVNLEAAYGHTVVRIQRPQMRKGEKCPVVIICHGLTGHKDERHLIALADSLQSYGIASVRFDFNGHGEYDTHFSDHTMAKELDDLQVIYEYVCGQDWADVGRIALSGHSQGGAVAGMKAGQLGAGKVKCLALLSPAACIHTMVMGNNLFGLQLESLEDMPDSVDFWDGRHLKKEYFQAARDLDIHAITAQYTGPTCMLIGDEDGADLYADAIRYKEFMPQTVEFIRAGYDHCYTKDPSDALIPAIHFLVDNLK